MQAAGGETPGPGSYGAVSATALGASRSCKAPSSTFRSLSSQRMKDRSVGQPWPGSYKPQMGAVEPNRASAGSIMRSKTGRFKAEPGTTDPSVGPGSHEATFDSRGHRVSVGLANDQRRVQSAAFISDTDRDLSY